MKIDGTPPKGSQPIGEKNGGGNGDGHGHGHKGLGEKWAHLGGEHMMSIDNGGQNRYRRHGQGSPPYNQTLAFWKKKTTGRRQSPRPVK